MTNFEYYKEEFLELAKKGIDPVVTIDGHVSDCAITPCAECIWDDESVITCNATRYIWGYSEYISKTEINAEALNAVLAEE